ncbi:MAG: VTT domain-containing protein [Candidatus Thermoplasmatota archaeon]|nr:VTT domain-containing protein [Candidatus Thermoplasmatota archaeon]MEC8242789.1 VTT domain-containing protein [Candidatus Thermoplasmatota archaeon]MEC8249271.1 VTT domain-containing protein [Candidatus Thermoplasmatota archaeon]MEC8258212.1 VTT domain-containing protein [Candidatus Thermoplasmatota archaeon]MEC8353065.1 VTT domain-containing protein [Candidatus Thermoplasmatota archaeon]
MSWYTGILDFILERTNSGVLGMVSFTEAIIQPLPPDLVYLPMLYDAMDNKPLVFWYFVVVTLTSVAGSYVGYLLGQRWGRQLLDRFAKPKHVTKLEALTTKYGTIGIFIAAVSPIPYKVFGWVAGMGEMDKRSFIVAGLFGRGLRFGMEALLIGIYGKTALDAMNTFLDNEILIAVVMIIAIVTLYFIWQWWSNLGKEATISP